MPSETHLVTELGTMKARAKGPATAGIWLATGECQFPRTGWNDFVVVILGWWSAAILRLLTNKGGRERVHFMEGPYAVEVYEAPSGKLQLRMFAGPGGGAEVAAGEADKNRFVTELTVASKEVLDECRLRGWWSPDAEKLALDLQHLDCKIAGET